LIQWTMKITSGALLFALVGCAYQLGQLKKDPQIPEPVISQHQKELPLQRIPADVGVVETAQMKAELTRLQEENAKLRASLIELQQKVASLPSKKKVSQTPVVPSNRKPSKVQKVATTSKKQKKPKVIQVSFDEPEKEPSKN
jgi:hypothetical protein